MEYALMTEPQVGGTYEDLRRLASWAEDRGLTAFARSDHYLDGEHSRPATDALASLAALARDTARIRLTVLVAPITFRHPAVLAKTAATIDQISGGRLDLGIGTGWMQSEHDAFGVPLPPLPERFAMLTEALQVVRAALGKDGNGFAGNRYRIADIDVLPRPTGPLPIVVGGSGARRTPELAGRYADEFNTFGGHLETLPARIGVMRRAAAEAGRDPEAITVSIMTPVIGAADRAAYREVLGAEAARRGLDPGDLEERLAARGIPHGTASDIAEFVTTRERIGVTKMYVQQYRDLGEIDTAELDRTLDLLPR